MVPSDALTGYVHEAPEAYGQVAYDGFGNPVGFLLPHLFRLLRGRARPPQPAMMPPPEPVPAAPDMGEVAYDGLGQPVGLLPPFLRPGLPIPTPSTVWSPLLRRFVQRLWSPTQQRWVTAPTPGTPPFPAVAPWRRPWPTGWIRPPLPYTGLGPNRLYLRCAVWPGPRGLVPALAMQPQAAAPGGMVRRGRRRFRRRR